MTNTSSCVLRLAPKTSVPLMAYSRLAADKCRTKALCFDASFIEPAGGIFRSIPCYRHIRKSLLHFDFANIAARQASGFARKCA